MAACLLTQIFGFASLANAYQEFDLLDGATPACKDCAANNTAPAFDQTRVATQSSYGQAPAMVGSDPVVEAPPAIGETTPVTVKATQHTQNALQIVQGQPLNNQPFANQEIFMEQHAYADQQFVQTQYPQSGGLGESAFEYPSDAQPLSYQPASDFTTGYEQTGFEQTGFEQSQFNQTQIGHLGYDQVFDSGVEQINYDSQYPTQDFGPAIVSEMPVEQYSPIQTYDSYQAMPSVTQQQNFAQTYTSSASGSGNVQPGLAQQKADQAAQSGIQGHLGGGLGGAKYEGVGWSNHSAQNAINSCCYWGVRPTAQIGVSKGNDGFWYACVLYY